MVTGTGVTLNNAYTHLLYSLLQDSKNVAAAEGLLQDHDGAWIAGFTVLTMKALDRNALNLYGCIEELLDRQWEAKICHVYGETLSMVHTFNIWTTHQQRELEGILRANAATMTLNRNCSCKCQTLNPSIKT
ncbi:hypothetical protein GOBAR_DD34969 [Gossypium barbadense]|nr:hypothetical protein GOBAR_DD34969 [Gossypium barbadense]